ncbi:hypothetical protein [Peribacillus simplex]|nr:hypothetical protein [Peribacillus simplex]
MFCLVFSISLTANSEMDDNGEWTGAKGERPAFEYSPRETPQAMHFT